jgi:eukaryotic-like serine/threonine-protein kinase
MASDRWRQIEELYQSAQKLAAAERSALLAGADPDLRREVEALLAEQGDSTVTQVAVGFQLGTYRIEAPIGEGGMGVVYRALDTKLNRPVAVKFLSNELADAEARRRFQREAQLASALNHPHILTVYDAGEFEGRQYLVTEFVDGGTLKSWAKQEPRTWRQIIELLTGVADGLAAAHQAGILHRDIKPENILVAKNGYAKLADFGLAKAAEGAENQDLTRTLTERHTRAGLIVGTIAYMSPEQASGKPLDARSDIFSFGIVLYEILGGKRPFTGVSDLELLKTIIHGSPEPLGGEVPLALRNVVEKALEKDPAERYQSMREMVVDVRRIARHSAETAAPTVPAPAPRPKLGRPAYIAAGLIVLALLLIGGGAKYFFSAKSPVTSTSEYTQITNFTDSAVAPALSADGRMVAFIRGGNAFLSGGQIYVKLLPNGESVKLTEGPRPKYGPVFTPDGSRVAFTWLTDGWDTWTVPALGGKPTRFLPNASGLTWTSDQHILYSEIMGGRGLHMGIVTSTESRAEEREIYFPPHERAMAHYSYASPDRKSALIVEMDRTATWQPCRLLPLDGTSQGRQVGPLGSCTAAGWSPDGKWMYFSASTEGGAGPDPLHPFGNWHLWRQRFPNGTPEQITFGPTEEEGVAVAPDGRSLITSVGIRRSEIWIHDAGGDRPLSSEGFTFLPVLSESNKRVYYLMRQRSASELWSIDLSSGKTEHLVPGSSIADYAISRDESEAAYTTRSGEESQIWLAALDRRSPPRLVTRGGDAVSFGANGDLIFRALETKQSFLYRIRKDGSGRERIASANIIQKLSVSPDGEWVIVGVPGAQGDRDTLAFPVRGGDARIICSYNCPASWSPDGKFFYITTERSLSTNGRTLAIPLPPGKVLPDLPASGIASRADRLDIPGIKVLNRGAVSAGNDPSTYVFTKQDFQGNLFRIPLHP